MRLRERKSLPLAPSVISAQGSGSSQTTKSPRMQCMRGLFYIKE